MPWLNFNALIQALPSHCNPPVSADGSSSLNCRYIHICRTLTQGDWGTNIKQTPWFQELLWDWFLITCVDWLSEVVLWKVCCLKCVIQSLRNHLLKWHRALIFCHTDWKAFQNDFLQTLHLISAPTHVQYLCGVIAPKLCCKTNYSGVLICSTQPLQNKQNQERLLHLQLDLTPLDAHKYTQV